MKNLVGFIFFFILSASTVAQTVADENEKDVYIFKSEPVASPYRGGFFTILDQLQYAVGLRRNNKTQDVLLWDLETGNSELLYSIDKKDYDDYEYDEDIPSIESILATHDQSKVIIYVGHSTRYNPKYETEHWWRGRRYDSPIKPTFRLICYSLQEQKIVWETERIRESINNPSAIHGLFAGISYDDRYFYYIEEKSVSVFSTETGNRENQLNFSFPESLNRLFGRNLICFSPKGRYIAYFEEAGYMNFNVHRGTSINIWDDLEKKPLESIYVKGRGVLRIAFTPDEQGILAVSNDNSLRLISIAEKQVTNIGKFNDFAREASDGFSISSGDQQFLLTGRSSVKIWLYPQMEQIFNSKGGCGILSKDGKLLLLSTQGQLYLLNTNDWGLKWQVEI